MENLKQKIIFEFQNHLIPWLIAIISFCLFVVFIYENRGLFIYDREVESPVILQTNGDQTIGEIEDDLVIIQSFIADKDRFTRIEIPFGTFNRVNEGFLKFQLRDGTSKKIIHEQDINFRELADGIYKIFDLQTVNHAKGKKFEIIITSDALQSGNSVTLWKSSEDEYKDGKLFIDGATSKGDLKFNVLDVNSKKLVSKKYFIVIGLILLSTFILMSLAVRAFKDQIHKVFLITALPIGLVLSIIIPPFDQLDENEHFFRAYEVAEGKFTNQVTEEGLGNYIPISLVKTIDKVRNIHQEGLNYDVLKEAFSIKLMEDDRILLRNYASSYHPIIYMPQSIGIIVGKVLNGSPLLMMYLGRLFNFSAYLLVTYFALKIVPVKKNVIFLIAMLPMAIIHAASLSPDSIINSTSLLFVAFILNLAYGSVEKINIKHTLIAIVIGMFIALSKIVYIPIIFLFLIIPISKFKNSKAYWLNFLMALVGCTIPFIIWNLLNISNLSVPDVRVYQNVSPKGQLLFILTHPIHYIKIFIDTMMDLGASQILSFMGKFATNYMYPTPSIVIYSFLFMLFFFGIINNEKDLKAHIRGIDKVIFLAIFSIVFILIYTALYVGFTNVGDPIINGIQGRYFIPIAAIFFLSLSNYKLINKDKNLDFVMSIIIHCSMFALLFQYIVNSNS